jgi:AcrR family transcriptional regulator
MVAVGHDRSVTADTTAGRRGRRPAGQETRDVVLAAAREEFAANGYDAASLRSIARRAGVDPGTVRHWFSDKARLFAAALGMSGVDPGALMRAAVTGPVDTLGTRLVRSVLEAWDADDHGAGIRMAVPVALSDPEKRRLLPEFLGIELLGPLAARLDPTRGAGPDLATARLRATLAATQMVGVMLVRYVVGVEPIASLPPERVAALVGPTLQRYLTGDLGDDIAPEGLRVPTRREENSSHGE